MLVAAAIPRQRVAALLEDHDQAIVRRKCAHLVHLNVQVADTVSRNGEDGMHLRARWSANQPVGWGTEARGVREVRILELLRPRGWSLHKGVELKCGVSEV